MDFPLNLESGRFVNGSEQLEQTFRILLQNEVMSFCQSYDVGSYFSLHNEDGGEITDIRRTLEEVSGVRVIDIRRTQDSFFVQLTYNGEEMSFEL